jgi:hypothetical protein
MSALVDELEQRKRNAEKLDRAKALLGTKWILHPANRVSKKCPAVQTPKSSRS